MDKRNYTNHLTCNEIKIDDPFWNKVIGTVRENMIPYQYLALQDKIESAEKSYCIENFKKAAEIVRQLKNGQVPQTYPVDKWHYDESDTDDKAFHGWVFQDSDVYKWIEAVGYSLINHPDNELEDKAKQYIDLICSAQLENGYLDTLYIINDRSKIFTNLKDHHELYCFGHMALGAISFYNATGDRKLLDAACRFADLICETFGKNKNEGYPGHELAEKALIKLYEVTGCGRYLDTAMFFIDQRGQKPFYFDRERGVETSGEDYRYNQAHMPVREQKEATGHAVRGVYLYSAMAEAAKIRNEESLYQSCKNIWENITEKKLYITGGIGANADGESFSFDYDLPNDLAYAETCASVGLIAFARDMSEIEINSKYNDVSEQALYNTVLSGMASDGKSFFYVNPLETDPVACECDSRKRHVKPVRQKWFSCACRPPNIAKIFSSLNEYICTQNDSTLFINQYIGCDINSQMADIKIISDYTNSGKISLNINVKKPFTLGLRIPSWCNDFSISGNYKESGGYAYIQIDSDCKIDIAFDIKIRLIKCSNLVRDNIGKVAVTRGPIVYCMEEADNGKNLHLLRLSDNSALKYQDGFILADGKRERPEQELYSDYTESKYDNCKIKFIPYYQWANRGSNEMSVYIRI